MAAAYGTFVHMQFAGRDGANDGARTMRPGAQWWLRPQGRPRLLADASCRPEVDEQPGPPSQ